MAILDLAEVILDLSVRLLLSLVWHVKFVFGWLVCVVYSHLFLSKKKNSHLFFYMMNLPCHILSG